MLGEPGLCYGEGAGVCHVLGKFGCVKLERGAACGGGCGVGGAFVFVGLTVDAHGGVCMAQGGVEL